MLCRVLAERRPDRDPTYVVNALGNGDATRSRLAESALHHLLYRNPIGLQSGVSRLVRAEPVKHYARDVGHWRYGRRLLAVISLGDTADSAAVPHVVRSLEDRKHVVRCQAAMALRRLDRDGALPPESVEQVADALVACLSDRKREVVEYAAAASSVPRMRHRLVEVRGSAGLGEEASVIVAAALDGQVVPLATTWEGDPGSGDDPSASGEHFDHG